jgi:hypothetical protein
MSGLRRVMKRHSRVLGDPGGRSFSAYGSICLPWEIYSAYGGDTMNVYTTVFPNLCSGNWWHLSVAPGSILYAFTPYRLEEQ